MRITVETYYEEVGPCAWGGDPALLGQHDGRPGSQRLPLSGWGGAQAGPRLHSLGGGRPHAHRHLTPFRLVSADLPAPDAAGAIGDHGQEVRSARAAPCPSRPARGRAPALGPCWLWAVSPWPRGGVTVVPCSAGPRAALVPANGHPRAPRSGSASTSERPGAGTSADQARTPRLTGPCPLPPPHHWAALSRVCLCVRVSPPPSSSGPHAGAAPGPQPHSQVSAVPVGGCGIWCRRVVRHSVRRADSDVGLASGLLAPPRALPSLHGGPFKRRRGCRADRGAGQGQAWGSAHPPRVARGYQCPVLSRGYTGVNPVRWEGHLWFGPRDERQDPSACDGAQVQSAPSRVPPRTRPRGWAQGSQRAHGALLGAECAGGSQFVPPRDSNTPLRSCPSRSGSLTRLRNARSAAGLCGPQAGGGEEAQPQAAEEAEQRPAEPVAQCAGAHRGEPEPEGGPGPRAEQLALRRPQAGYGRQPCPAPGAANEGVQGSLLEVTACQGGRGQCWGVKEAQVGCPHEQGRRGGPTETGQPARAAGGRGSPAEKPLGCEGLPTWPPAPRWCQPGRGPSGRRGQLTGPLGAAQRVSLPRPRPPGYAEWSKPRLLRRIAELEKVGVTASVTACPRGAGAAGGGGGRRALRPWTWAGPGGPERGETLSADGRVGRGRTGPVGQRWVQRVPVRPHGLQRGWGHTRSCGPAGGAEAPEGGSCSH